MTIFLAMVDEGGFARAARKLKISPQVVTRTARRAEPDWKNRPAAIEKTS